MRIVADFANDADGERSIINDWIAQNTNELIPFDPAGTSELPFTLADGATVDVPMMRYDEFLPTAYAETYQAVELPYGGGALSTVVIVPNNFAEFEDSLTVESLDAIFGSITDGGVHLTIPKWSTRTTVTLNDTLASLGMPTAFSSEADFSAMTGSPGLVLGLVEHQAFIEVDEEGTRAAAATGGVMDGSHGPTIEVNRPFFYVIRDKNAGTTLFVGRVLDPTIAAG